MWSAGLRPALRRAGKREAPRRGDMKIAQHEVLGQGSGVESSAVGTAEECFGKLICQEGFVSRAYGTRSVSISYPALRAGLFSQRPYGTLLAPCSGGVRTRMS